MADNQSENQNSQNPSDANDSKRKTLKKVGNVLQSAVKVSRESVIKKGTKVKKGDDTYDMVFRKDSSALARVTDDTFELSKDVKVNPGEILPAGTVLDPVSDKALIEELKKINPKLIGEADSVE